MIAVAEIQDADGLDNIRLLWESMWQRTRGASFFQSHAWFARYWHHFGRSQQMKVLLATLAGKPIGLLPLTVRRIDSRWGTLRALSYPLDDWGTCYGPLGNNSAATLVAAMRHLRDNRRDWDVLDLRHIDTERTDRGRTRNALRAAGMNCLARPGRTSALVDLEPGWTACWADRPLELRRAFHQTERQLERFGRLEFERFRPEARTYGDVDCRWDLFDQFQSLCRVAGTDSAADSAFIRDLHGHAARAAAVDLNLLRLDGRPIAAAYGYHTDGQVDVLRVAVTPGYRDEARLVLAAHLLKEGAGRGDRIYRFAPETDAFATDWQTGLTRTGRLTHFSPIAPKAQLMRWNHNVQSWWAALRRAGILSP